MALLALAACKQVESGPRSALILVPDGVRVEEFTSSDRVSDLTGLTGESYARKTWAKLPSNGVVVRAAVNPHVTITGPAHAALLTGRPEIYGNFPLDERGV